VLGLIGRTISHYHILEQIGQGGMSSVFRAVDLRDERAVAVKVLSPYIAHEPRFKARFEREIRLLHRMEHPNIMPILDFGEVDGLAYIIMPYMGSGTLGDRLARGPLETKEGARIVAQLASALECAHRNGVIHRDVKPSNVLLDPMGNVLLSDFSFAHQADASQNLTGSALVGTPAYMAPEQCRGAPIDARSDQYAMTVVLYQMCTGQLPFDADTPMGIALKHVNEPLPRPSLVNPDLPPEIEMVLVKGLAKDPDLRFGTVTALNEAFQQATAIALDPSRRTRTHDLHRTGELYNKYQNVIPPVRRRWFERSAVLAALLLLVALPASAAGIAIFFPGVIARNGGPIDIQGTVNVLLTANAPGEGTRLPPGALETAVYLAVLQTLAATGAPLGDATLEAVVQALATEGTPTPFAFELIFPTATPTSSRTSPAAQEFDPSLTVAPTRTPSLEPTSTPTSSTTASDTATPTGAASATLGPSPTSTPTATPSPTRTLSFTPSHTPTATRTPTPAPPTATRTPTNTRTPNPPTLSSVPSATKTPSTTSVPSSATSAPSATPVPPTSTPAPPTAVPTPTPVPPTKTSNPGQSKKTETAAAETEQASWTATPTES